MTDIWHCYREMADPSVLYEGNKWYLYGTPGMVFWTEDYKHWNYTKILLGDEEIMAPTIVKHDDKFYCIACGTELYEAPSPLGPFESIGCLKTCDGKELRVNDPMLFSDDDGRLYLYYGCGDGIWCAELDAKHPSQLLSEPVFLFADNTREHVWERMGANNEDGSFSWVEGAWMFKHNGVYYLIYCAPATQYSTYAMGAYKSQSPLGPFEYMKTSPFITKQSGVFKGAGHGSIVKGPNDTVWAFYTGIIGYANFVERFVGMQPIGFDEQGDIIPVVADDTPQWIPGVKEKPYEDNNAGLVPVTSFRKHVASSEAAGRDGIYALDENVLSWWQPLAEDEKPSLTVNVLHAGGKPELMLYAVRVVWRYIGMDVVRGKLPTPVKYKIEALTPEDEWVCILDKTDNQEDMYFDYQLLVPTYAKKVRLVITERPKDMEVGVIDFSVYGKWEP